MPNHVINFVTFSDRLDEIREYVKGNPDEDDDQRIFDFNRIIPMSDEAVNSIDERSTGTPSLWYNWAVENWGTKWNCYEVQEIHRGFAFWTAWSCPEPIFVALSKKFPDVTITVDFADEDIGYNCGTLTIKNGEVEYEQGDVQFAKNLWGYEDDDDEEEDDSDAQE